MTQKTLLDEFAMAALNGILSNDELRLKYTVGMPLSFSIEGELSRVAYKYAKSMMQERQKYETK